MAILKRLLFLLLPVYCFGQTINPGGAVTISCATCPACPSPIIIHDTVKTNTTLIIHDTVKINTTLIIHDSVCPTVPPIVTPPPISGYTQVFGVAFDKSSDVTANQLGEGKWVPDFGGSFMSYVSGTINTSSGYRSEQQYDQDIANPVEGAVEWDAYYKDWKSVGFGGSSIQWHPQNNNSALLFIYTNDGTFNFARSMNGSNFYQTGTMVSVMPNVWYHLRMEFKWSTGKDGYARFYINGVLNQGYSFTGITQDGSGKPYLKLGQNRWVTLTPPTTIYYKNLKVYKKN